MNEASSAKSNAHRDAGQPSFSDSLGEAKQHAETKTPTDSRSQHKASSNKNSESDKTVKRPKRDQATSSIDTSRLQRIDETGPNATALQLPTNFNAVVGENQDQFEDSPSSTDVEHSHTISDSPMQGSSWLNFGGSPAWSQQQLSATPKLSSNTDVAAPADSIDSNEQDGSAAQLAELTPSAPSPVSSTVPPTEGKSPTAPPTASQDLPYAAAETADSVASASNAAAAAAQTSATSAQMAPLANTPQQSLPSGLSVSSVSASKASNAFKTVQSLKASPKDPALSTNLPAGAKETDSYLSIQKEAKSGGDTYKDLTATPQHTDRNQTAQSFVTPIATPIQTSPVSNSHVHQQPVAVNPNDATIASQQKTQEASLSSQLQQAAVATPSATSEHLSTVVNSAKLMQTINQSEMRVGMRTAEFGDISIRTSAGRDSISAQISLGHDDLAKTLTAHMPEMQTRLTTGEVVDVHIHSDSQAASFTGGQSGSNNSGAQSQQQDSGSSRPSAYNSYAAERSSFAAMPAAIVAATASNSSRLDIRA